MFIKDTKIYYDPLFLTAEDLNQIDAIIEENDLVIKSQIPLPGGYKTFPFENQELLDSLTERVSAVIRDNYEEGFEHIYPRNEIQFMHGGTGMSPHDDGNGHNVKHGVVLYISVPERYEGGNIYYPKLNIELKPKRGSLVIHPREDDYTHGVKEVKSGLRFVMVMFTG
jgi:hypothetical protein